ncbi:trehalose-phosphatase [Pseudoroseomonas rhizosphaerae]|uniref:Trehalose 6-phosphate phosphatase n=1 Tax=Teichococcus rhizosphaerae TaxID=1335062 RepID=A0A2C7A6P8_9PROT|nr:trehalose-phosphatase [Pseudoroseomonas rhizosphaerae]PHK94030.1 trehalose-phosphatase [Pseudoroseomonas rhizosphaerae]
MEHNAFPDSPPLPQRDAALFLDLDGTLLEIAPRPDAVVVPPQLPPLLARLSAGLGGAVAIVTGRGLEVARALTRGGLAGTPPIAFAAEHGTIIDASALPGAAIPPMPPPPFPPEAWRAAAEAFVEARPGLLLEEKKHGFVLHFRAVPERGEETAAFLHGLAAGSEFQVLPAHAAAELRPRATDKGVAVSWLMRHPPFAGRVPIFIGDDVTDEFGIEACKALGGTGYRIPRDFPGPAAVLHWLGRIAERMPA